MQSFIYKADFSGLMVALSATIAKRHPGWSGLRAFLVRSAMLRGRMAFWPALRLRWRRC